MLLMCLLKFAFLTVNPAATVADLTVIATSLFDDIAVHPFVAAPPVADIAMLVATALINDIAVFVLITTTVIPDIAMTDVATTAAVAILTVATAALIAIATAMIREFSIFVVQNCDPHRHPCHDHCYPHCRCHCS